MRVCRHIHACMCMSESVYLHARCITCVDTCCSGGKVLRCVYTVQTIGTANTYLLHTRTQSLTRWQYTHSLGGRTRASLTSTTTSTRSRRLAERQLRSKRQINTPPTHVEREKEAGEIERYISRHGSLKEYRS